MTMRANRRTFEFGKEAVESKIIYPQPKVSMTLIAGQQEYGNLPKDSNSHIDDARGLPQANIPHLMSFQPYFLLSQALARKYP